MEEVTVWQTEELVGFWCSVYIQFKLAFVSCLVDSRL